MFRAYARKWGAKARVKRKVPSKTGIREYLRVNLARIVHCFFLLFNIRMEEYLRVNLARIGEELIAVPRARGSAAMDLDFIPLMEERYDLMLTPALLEDRRIRELRKILESTVFQKKVEELGGYRREDSGKLDIVGGSKNG